MGVDFFPCDNCGQSVCDCGHFVRCNGDSCSRRWCSPRCARADGWQVDEESGYSCKFCRNEDLTDTALLDRLLNHLGLTRAEAARDMLEIERVGAARDA